MYTTGQSAGSKASSNTSLLMAMTAICVIIIMTLMLITAGVQARTLAPTDSSAAKVPDLRLVGKWNGTDRFFGMSHEEVAADPAKARYVEAELTIAADGVVKGTVGGAELQECVVEPNRGWLGRLFHIKTDYIFRGKMVGQVTPVSESAIHLISAPFDLESDQIDGSIFVMRGGFSYPYPILKLRLARKKSDVVGTR